MFLSAPVYLPQAKYRKVQKRFVFFSFKLLKYRYERNINLFILNASQINSGYKCIRAFMRLDQEYSECCCQLPFDSKVGSDKHSSVSASAVFTGLALCDFSLFFKIKMTRKVKYFRALEHWATTQTQLAATDFPGMMGKCI